jgi:hypothetical protein
MLFNKNYNEKRNKENDSFCRQKWVILMKNKPNREINVELLLLET